MKTALKAFNFSPDNGYEYMQDRRWHKGLPSTIDFYPVEESNGWLKLIGNGFGMLSSYEAYGLLPGLYGNGAIFVPSEQFSATELNEFKLHLINRH